MYANLVITAIKWHQYLGFSRICAFLGPLTNIANFRLKHLGF